MATGFRELGSQCFLSNCMELVNGDDDDTKSINLDNIIIDDDDDTKSVNLDDIIIDDDAGSVFGNDDELNSEESGSGDMGAKPSGNVRKPAKPCQISVKMNCDIVKFILNRKKYSEELHQCVSKLNAEVQLIPDKSCIKFTKKPGTKNIKNWHKKCISLVKRFCNRFGKDCFSLDKENQDSVRDAFLKLNNKLFSTAADYWMENNKTLAVMSEKSERDDVLKKVRACLNICEDGFQECKRKNRNDESNWRKLPEFDAARKMVAVGETQSNAFNLLNDKAITPKYGQEVSGHVSKKKLVKQLQNFVKIGNDIVKFLTKRKKHYAELKERLFSLGAELVQVNSVTGEIRLKKIDSTLVEDWGKKCEDTVKAYCRRFYKKHFRIDDSIQDSISEGLTTIQKTVSLSGGACWLDKPKQNLIVVCLKVEQSDVEKAVQDFIQKVRIFAKKYFEIEAPIRELVKKSLPKLEEELQSCQVTFDKQSLTVMCLRNEIDNVVLKVKGFLQGIKIGNECKRKNKSDESNWRKPSEYDAARKMVTVDEPQSNAPKREVSDDVIKKKPIKQLQKSVKIDNDIVKFLTKRKKYSIELKEQLLSLGGELDQVNSVTGEIRLKKIDSTLVEDWGKKCEDIVNLYCGCFHKQYFPIDDSIHDSVSEGLSTLQNTVGLSGGACWLDKAKQNLIVVCLKVEQSDVEKAVKEFIQNVSVFAKKYFKIEAPIPELVQKSLPRLEAELRSCKVTFEKQTLAVVCSRKEIDNVVLKVEGFLQGIKIGNGKLGIEKPNSKLKALPSLMQVDTSSVHNESGASTVNWRNKSRRNSLSSRGEGRQLAARGRPKKLQPVCVKMNKELIKFVMENEQFTKELTDELENFNGEIEWKYGIDFIAVVQKSEEVFVPNWSEQCKSLVTKFFQRFGYQSSEVREEIEEENEKSQETVMFVNVFSDHIDYLEHTQFLESVKQSHLGITEATVVKNGARNQVRFVGLHEQVLAAKQQCVEMVKELIVMVLKLPTEAMNFVSQRAGLEFIEKCLSDRDIVSVLLVEPKSSVKIVTKSVEEYEKVIECLSNNVCKTPIPLPSRNEHMFNSRKWDEISKTIKTEELVDFQINSENGKKSDITLHGATYLVQKYNDVVQAFVSSQKIESFVMNLPTGVARYLKEKLSAEVERIKAELREEQVKIEIGSRNIDFEGTKDGIHESTTRVALLRSEIVLKSKEFTSVGVGFLFSGEDGQRNIKGIEAGYNVVIEVARVFNKESTGLAQAQLAVRQVEAYEKNDHEIKQALTAPMDPFDQCNFTTREGLQVSWKYGNIAQERADILVNSANSDLNNPTIVGRVLNAVGGPVFQAACNQHSSIGTGEIATTIGGNLACNYVIHAVCCAWHHSSRRSEQVLRGLFHKIFVECRRQSARSVAMPLIGTGKHKFPEDVVLRIMKEEIETFSAVYPEGTLREIKLVRYDQDKGRTVQAVQVAAHAITRAAPIAKPRSRFVPLAAGSGEEGVTLQVYARSKDNIDSAFLEIKKFITSHITSTKVEDEKAFEVANKHWDELKRLASKGLKIKCIDVKTVSIEGLTSKVLEVKNRFTELVSRFTDEERRSNQFSYISQNVQWYYSDLSNREVAYGVKLNGVIELARMDGKATVEITDSDGYRYDIYFNQMVAWNKMNGQTKKLTRKVIGSGSDLSLPSNWLPQQADQVVQLVTLSRSSQEFMEVQNHFTLRGGQANQLYKVERIQNPRLYSAFLVLKKSMRNPNELRLFHGTDAANIHSINANNFSRSFAGVNGTAYGNGVYFARDASYSIRYAKQQCSGSRPKMYMAKVLVGDYTKGSKGMKAPPSKNDPYNPGVRYDSVVDHRSNPSMYIIFQDNQCYPEYLLTLNH